MLEIQSLDHVALTVRDPHASMQWYQEILGFTQASMEGLSAGPPFILRVASESYLNLFPADTGSPASAPDHNTIAMRHVAFRVDYLSIPYIEEDLKSKGLAVQGYDYGPRCRSLFVSDPDGHQIELIGYGDGVFTT